LASIPLPTGSYRFPEPKASVRRLVNCYAEAAPQITEADSKDKLSPVILRRAPGISTFCQISAGDSIRGMWMMLGVLFAVCGNSLYSVSPQGVATALASGIYGNGRVYMSDNTGCLVIIIPGTNQGWCYANGALSIITDNTFLTFGALNLGFIDSYIVFLATNGREFYNSDSKIISGSGPLTFTAGTEFPREFGADLFAGMAIDHRQITMFGQLTSEVFIDTGNATNSPFSSAPNNFIELGCINGNTITKQDQSIYWIANDRTVRKQENQTPVRVSNHGIESVLETAYLNDAYGLAYSIGGHMFYAINMPTAKRCLVYDCTTTEWHELESYKLGYWRVQCTQYYYGMQLVGDSLSGTIGKLDSNVFNEFENTRVAKWTHQPYYVDHNRVQHKRFEVVMGTGSGPLTGQGSDPLLTLKISDDGGNTFRTMPTKSLGKTGKRLIRATWYRLGMARERVYQLELSDPVETWVGDAQLETGVAKN
jgi:hypothetical protein